jgi:hypothetical protein
VSFVLGLVVETVVIKPGKLSRIVIKCSDRSVVDDEFKTAQDLEESVGAIVGIRHDKKGRTWIHWL